MEYTFKPFDKNQFIRCLLDYLADHENTTAAELTSEQSRNRFIGVRKLAMYTLWHDCKIDFETIGEIFNRDHATVRHHIANIKNELRLYIDTRNRYKYLTIYLDSLCDNCDFRQLFTESKIDVNLILI